VGNRGAFGARLALRESGSLRRGANNTVDIPGASELQALCSNARAVLEVCEAMGLERGGVFEGAVPGAHLHHDHSQDHEDPPYIWDVEP